MKEEEKIFRGELFCPADPELKAIKLRSHKLSARYSRTAVPVARSPAPLIRIRFTVFPLLFTPKRRGSVCFQLI